MEKRKNIIFILTDDQGEWAMRCSGNPDVITPNLDYLASKGARFNEFFCASPVCSPARASIMTGMIPSQHGVHDWICSGNLDKDRLGVYKNDIRFQHETKPIDYLDGMETYTDILKKKGYTCALAGKWHLGNSKEPQHGFDKWFTIGRGGGPYYNLDVVEHGKLYYERKYITDVITDKALEFMAELREEGNPYYLSIHYTAPHSPWNEEDQKKEIYDLYEDCKFENTPNLPLNERQIRTAPFGEGEERKRLLRGYYSAITAMDQNVGRIIEDLKEHGEWENTIVMFTGDNGMNMGHHGIWGKGNGTFPFNFYDTAIKVPFLLRIPGVTGENQVIDNMHSHYDLIHTIAELVEECPSNQENLPGKSILKEFTTEHNDDGHIVIFDEYGANRVIRTKDYKFIKRYEEGEDELYDLVKDPQETNNVCNNPSYEAIKEQLETQLLEWYKLYAKPETDGLKEAVTGFGQIQKANDTNNTQHYVQFKGEKYAVKSST